MITIGTPQLSPVDFSADAAVGYLNGCITNKYKAVINLTFQKYTSKEKRLQFASVGGVNTITNINNLDTDSFLSTYDFQVGETIIIPGSGYNAGTLTITAVADRVLTVSNTLTPGIDESKYIYVNKKVTAIDFFYNLLANSDIISFLSKTDKGVLQKYTISGIDPTVSTPTFLNIGTTSFAWVTDIVTGVASTSAIAGAGMTGYTSITGSYVQSFQIVHYFYQAPFWLNTQYNNFSTLTPTSDFQDAQSNGQPISNGWQYVCQINAKYFAGPVVNDQSISTRVPGNAAWFNMNNSRTLPEFYLNSIAYVNAATSASMTALDCGQNVNVTLKIKSRSGLFINPISGNTYLVLTHFRCPMSASDYQNTATTLLQNFMHDKCVFLLGSGGNGINYSGNYQVMKTVASAFVDSSNITVTFQISYAQFLKTILLSKQANDRNYALSLACETTQD